MGNAKLDLLRYRNASGLIDVTCRFIKQNFWRHFKSLLIFVFPVILFGFLFIDFLETRPYSFSNGNTALLYSILKTFLLIFCSVVFIIMCTLSFKFVQLYIKFDSINFVSINNIWKESKANLGWMIGYSIFLGGYIFLFNVLFSAVFYFINSFILTLIFAPPILLLFVGSIIFYLHSILLKMEEQHLDFFKVLQKCFQLLKNNWWTTLGFITIFFILLGVMTVLAMFPALIIDVFHLIIESNSPLALWLQKIANITSVVLVFLLYSYIFIAIAISFYSLYAKLTGSNLKNQIDSIGKGLNYETTESI